MCVQYIVGYSVDWWSFRKSVKYHMYIGKYLELATERYRRSCEGYHEYIRGVHCGDIMIHAGEYRDSSGGCHYSVGGYHEQIRVC